MRGGLCSVCGEPAVCRGLCRKHYSKDYYQRNKEKLKDRRIDYYYENREEEIEKSKRYNRINKEKRSVYLKKYSKLNKEKIRECRLKYHKGEHYIEYQKRYHKWRKRIDLNFKITTQLRTRMWIAINASGGCKGDTTFKLSGCSINELRIYLESLFQEGMSWKNHSVYGWHIDHIKPCCSFDLTKEEEQKKCFHYTNLQPLWAEENWMKNGKVIA